MRLKVWIYGGLKGTDLLPSELYSEEFNFSNYSEVVDEAILAGINMDEINLEFDTEAAEEIYHDLSNFVSDTSQYSSSFDTLIAHIILVESNIVSNEELTHSDASSLLIFTSVLRHSADFWYHYKNLENPPSKPWYMYLLPDALGAFIGFKLGGIFGAIAGAVALSIIYELVF